MQTTSQRRTATHNVRQHSRADARINTILHNATPHYSIYKTQNYNDMKKLTIFRVIRDARH